MSVPWLTPIRILLKIYEYGEFLNFLDSDLPVTASEKKSNPSKGSCSCTPI